MSSPPEDCRVWTPCLYSEEGNKENKYILILLNQPVLDTEHLIRLWNGACYKVAVDGGATVWHKILNNMNHKIEFKIPDLISGDFDSACMDNVNYFKENGSEVVETMDQDRTDFTKCLDVVGRRLKEGTILEDKSGRVSAIYTFVENSGRLDQILANIQSLILGVEYTSIQIYLIGSVTISWILPPGNHQISLPDVDLKGLNCGIIPISGPARLTSKGLKWNLDNAELKFGELVSTSNSFVSNEVFIVTDNTVLWTMDRINME